ncbi:NADAR family protein [Planosporangium sp. 12N6]|uniref:NADAR family protein n=1 Tax=Planosporangium spinosum TaxID=3402278 RepID=UPI003CEEE253
MRVDDLITAEHHGELPELLFFWGHRPAARGGVGKSCLSQWYPASFDVDGTTYPTAEHYMMAAKARLFGDAAAAEAVLAAPTPDRAKSVGRRVRRFDERTWAAHRYDVVVAGNLAKFQQHPPLLRFLLATGSRVLVEASPDDRIWGIGLSAEAPDAQSPARWRGQNLLGFALMEVRAKLG